MRFHIFVSLNILLLYASNTYTSDQQAFGDISNREQQAIFQHASDQKQPCMLCKDNKAECLDELDLMIFAAAGLILGYIIGKVEVEKNFLKKL